MNYEKFIEIMNDKTIKLSVEKEYKKAEKNNSPVIDLIESAHERLGASIELYGEEKEYVPYKQACEIVTKYMLTLYYLTNHENI